MVTHTLTTEQLRKLAEAIGDGSDWPKHTDDPRVNYAVDCIVQNDGDVPFNEQLYAAEIEVLKVHAQRT